MSGNTKLRPISNKASKTDDLPVPPSDSAFQRVSPQIEEPNGNPIRPVRSSTEAVAAPIKLDELTIQSGKHVGFHSFLKVAVVLFVLLGGIGYFTFFLRHESSSMTAKNEMDQIRKNSSDISVPHESPLQWVRIPASLAPVTPSEYSNGPITDSSLGVNDGQAEVSLIVSDQYFPESEVPYEEAFMETALSNEEVIEQSPVGEEENEL